MSVIWEEILADILDFYNTQVFSINIYLIFNKVMLIKKTFISMVVGDLIEQKTLALAIYLKYKLTDSRFKHYTLNKLANATGLDYKTLRKYMALLISHEYAHIEGMDKKQIFVVNSLAAKKQNCNVDIGIFDCTSLKTTIKSLRAFIVMHLQAKKDEIKQILQARNDPKRSDDYREVRKKVRKLVREGVLQSPIQEYKEYGLSYKRIAKELGCSIVTAVKIVKCALEKGWATKQRNFEQIYDKGVNGVPVEGYTFTTKDYLYIIHPNTYTLSPSVSASFPSNHIKV